MNSRRLKLPRRYKATLQKYLRREGEAILAEGYEVGRAAIGEGLGVLDMAQIHEEALKRLLQGPRPSPEHDRTWKAAKCFLLESLSPFEAMHRGFRETNVRLQQLNRALEKRNDELARTNRRLETEIGERQRTEKALRESEQRFSMLIETANDVIFSLTHDGRFSLLNRAFETLTGWRRAAWLGKPFAALLHPEDVDLAVERFHALLRGMSPERWEYRLRKANGEYLIGELTLALELKESKPVGIFGIGRDITRRRKAEEALRESEERFRLMVASVKDYMICMLDPKGCVASWNLGAERATGYRAEEVLGRSVSMFYSPEDIASGKLKRTLQMLQRSARIEEESWRVRKDGSRFLVSAVLTAVRDARGNLRGYVKVARDITERKRAEETLRQSELHFRRLFNEAQEMQQDLRELSERLLRVQEDERKRLSRELHDEVGQALTAVSVSLATLRNNGNGQVKLAKALAGTQHVLRQAMDTVHHFARELRPAMLEELGLLPALRSYITGFAERTGLQVRLCADPLAEKLGDEQKVVLFRIAQESLTNVAKHAEASRVEVLVRKDRDGVCLEVADNGKSFREDAVNSAQRRQRLGLLGMQERVRLVNGRFSVKPQPGKGTTVQVVVPFKVSKPMALSKWVRK
jgi:PAS domain S-box-containing protein